jgi:hypothetical protein
MGQFYETSELNRRNDNSESCLIDKYTFKYSDFMLTKFRLILLLREMIRYGIPSTVCFPTIRLKLLTYFLFSEKIQNETSYPYVFFLSKQAKFR